MERRKQHNSAIAWSARAWRTVEQPISFLIATAIANPRLINLAAGLVDESTLPIEPLVKTAQEVLAHPEEARAALQYGTTAGLSELRRRLLAHVEGLEGKSAGEMNLSAEDVLITTGSQQSLYLIGEALIDPGDIVIAANPSYFVYTGTLGSMGARILTVPMDESGMQVEALEALLLELERSGELPRVKLIYCTSFFQNPTGLTLSEERRGTLLELARRFSRGHRIVILEDAAYRELRYDGPALASIKSRDADNAWTILTQTFSKPFAPGIKLGYTLLPTALREALVNQKGNHDFGSSSLCQHLALGALRNGSYSAQVTRLCGHYRTKRDAMLGALDRHLPREAGIRWTHPHGGLYVWVELPETIDTGREGALFGDCVRRGMLYVPGAYCYQADENGRMPRGHLRLSFGQAPIESIEPGVARLGEAVAAQLGTARR